MERRDAPITLVRLGGSGNGRRSWLAVGLVLATAAGLVAVGALNRTEPPPETAAAPTAAFAPAATLAATAEPSAAAPEVAWRLSREDITLEGGVVQIRSAGYRVAYATDEGHQPAISDDGALAIFGFGDRDTDGGYPELVSVAVGTPAKGALIPTSRRFPRIYGRTVDELQAAYGELTGVEVTAVDYVVIDGQIARQLQSFKGTPLQSAMVITVHGKRAFVFNATSLELLREFLSGFRFGPPLFVSEGLGFQVPLPLSGRPFGTEVGIQPDPVTGLYVFDDGVQLDQATYSHAIGVSVGTEARPALVRVIPSDLRAPPFRRIWGATLSELTTAYQRVAGPGTGVLSTRLGGEPALLIVRADGMAVTVLAVHEGRAYLVMTNGHDAIEAAPSFQIFLDSFTFLD